MALYEFGSFVLDAPERRLTRAGHRVPVRGKTFDVLRVLLEAEGRLVDRQTFNTELWPEVVVEDRNLTVHISNLRRALGGTRADDYIETVAKAGYRMAVPVRVMAAPANDRSPSSEAAALLREARHQLNEAERIPALKALGLFERSLELDRGNAWAHAGLASTYLLLASTTIRRPLPVEEAVRLATVSAHRALAIDPRLGEPYAVLGRLKMTYDWDWQGADADLVHAVALAPSSVEALVNRGLFLSAVGRHREAVESLTRAAAVDPTRRETFERLGLARWMAGDDEGALASLAEAVAIDPEARRPHFRRMLVLDHLGRHDEAAIDRAIWLGLYDEAAAAEQLAVLTQASGYRAAMAEWIARLGRQNQWLEAAVQAMAIDDRATALDGLERCVGERGDGTPYIAHFPSFRPLGGEPRFQRLLSEMKLAA